MRTRYAQDYGRKAAERLPGDDEIQAPHLQGTRATTTRAVEQVCPRRISNEE